MKIHKNWIRATSRPATGPTRICEGCQREFNHGTSNRLFCGELDCDRERDRLRKQEAAQRRQRFAEADAKRAQATQGD